MPAPATASMPPSTTSTPRSVKPAAKEELAQRAITPAAASPESEAALVSPSLQAIWQSFKEHGHGDTELLKLILSAKLKEDERLKSMDDLRTEQLRAQQAMWQYTMYQYMLVASAQQQQVAQAAAAAKGGPAPYSPLSPPPNELAPLNSNGTTSAKRPRASSSASSASSASDAVKKARTGTHSPPRTTTLAPGQKPSHADVMDALRRKCEANKQGQQQQPSSAAAAALSAARTSPSYPHRALAPAPTSSARTSMSPPLSTTTSGSTARRLSPPHVVPGRHTSFLRPAPPPAAAPSSAPQQGSAPRPASPPALASVREHPTDVAHEHAQPQAQPRNKLALLLHASESTASHFHTPSWLPQPQQATSDVRGSVVPAPAVVAAADA